ncbi:MAG TPA: MoaD/ThiS family protein [Chloroflexi bacterium]|nr:MoaD/ThiS family protein [Chloroflexota bacterium]
MQVTYRDRKWEFDQTMQVRALLKALDILPENVLVVRNGQLVTEDQHLRQGDEVKIVAVVSGG